MSINPHNCEIPYLHTDQLTYGGAVLIHLNAAPNAMHKALPIMAGLTPAATRQQSTGRLIITLYTENIPDTLILYTF